MSNTSLKRGDTVYRVTTSGENPPEVQATVIVRIGKKVSLAERLSAWHYDIIVDARWCFPSPEEAIAAHVAACVLNWQSAGREMDAAVALSRRACAARSKVPS